MRIRCGLGLLVSAVAVATLARWNSFHQQRQIAPRQILADSYGTLPLRFEANQGQSDPSVDFISRGPGYTMFLTSGEVVLRLAKSDSASVIRMKLVGARSKPHIEPLDRLPGNSNYLIGSDPSRWRHSVPNYSKVRYEGVYPGIDVVYYGNQKQLEYDFVVGAGRSAADVVLELDGVDRIEIADDGDLIAAIDESRVQFHKPTIYQERVDHSGRDLVEGRYVVRAERQIGFDVGAYDSTRPLIIDPVLGYSTYLGGTGNDGALGIAVDGSGNAYVTGYTTSTNFPVKAGGYQTTYRGGSGNFTPDGDVFVSKFNSSGSALLYSTYVGGTARDAGYGIAVDSAGNAYVTGQTSSTDFPTVSAFQPQYGNSPFGENGDSFVLKLNSTGTALVYSTYLSGHSLTSAYAIAVDSAGNAYVTGGTSFDFPTPNPLVYQSAIGFEDVFVAKLAPSGGSLIYAKLIGGSDNQDEGHGIALDSSGNTYITGQTFSTNFPTVTPIQSTNGGGGGDAFVTELNAAGTTLLYSTYLGGGSIDNGYAIAVDASGSAFVVGSTSSTGFPTTAGALNRTMNGNGQAFAAKLSSSGSSLVYSTFVGGQQNGSEARGVAVDKVGNAYLTGQTCASDFPTVNAIQSQYAGFSGFLCDAFVSKLNSTGSALVYSTYLGGSAGDKAFGLALDGVTNVYIAGLTTSTNFPIANALQSASAGPEEAFVARVAMVPSILPFTDDPLQAGVTPVKAVHVTELRSAVDSLRTSNGLAAFAWTDPSLVAGTTSIKAQHIIDLRTALGAVYTKVSQPQPTYTDASLGAGTTIKAVHIAEVRAAVIALEK